MGFLDGFKKQKQEEDRKLIDGLFERTDKLSAAQLDELIRHAFFSYGTSGMGWTLMRFLVQRISLKIGSEFVPNSKEDFEKWLNEVFVKVDQEQKKAIFVTAVFDIYQHSIISGSDIMQKIDAMLNDLQKDENFKKLSGKGD